MLTIITSRTSTGWRAAPVSPGITGVTQAHVAPGFDPTTVCKHLTEGRTSEALGFLSRKRSP